MLGSDMVGLSGKGHHSNVRVEMGWFTFPQSSIRDTSRIKHIVWSSLNAGRVRPTATICKQLPKHGEIVEFNPISSD